MRPPGRGALAALALLVTLAAAPAASAQGSLPRDRPLGSLEQVAAFRGSMPTGITVSRTGRRFVNFPRWEDRVPYTVAELRGGRAVPFPGRRINRLDLGRAATTFVSVQSVVVDPRDRLWVLDTGA